MKKADKNSFAGIEAGKSTTVHCTPVSPSIANAHVGRSAGKKVSYQGYKAILPENVSMNAFKKIVEISSGFDYCIQPFINLLSNQLKSKQNNVR
jgi:hypothetical protein